MYIVMLYNVPVYERVCTNKWVVHYRDSNCMPTVYIYWIDGYLLFNTVGLWTYFRDRKYVIVSTDYW